MDTIGIHGEGVCTSYSIMKSRYINPTFKSLFQPCSTYDARSNRYIGKLVAELPVEIVACHLNSIRMLLFMTEQGTKYKTPQFTHIFLFHFT